MMTESGRVRHSVCFSIVHEEWPGVQARLEEMGVGGLGTNKAQATENT